MEDESHRAPAEVLAVLAGEHLQDARDARRAEILELVEEEGAKCGTAECAP
jgi:hypothetical protein